MAKKYKVVVLDSENDMSLFESTIAKLLNNDVEVVKIPANDTEALIRDAADCDGILNPLTTIKEDTLSKLTKCKVIVKMGIGYDNIDADAAAKLGIQVANIPDYCQGEVADQAMALFLTLNRRVYLADRQIRQGVWNDRVLSPDTPRLAGRKFGILGCGYIARACAVRARAFGMEIIGYDPFVDAKTLADLDIKKIENVDDFLAEADFISLHIPALKENIGFVNLERLKKMKRSCLLINTARGAIINEADLYTALKEKIIAGAGLDVRVSEPPKQPDPLAELDNIVMTPHIGYYSVEADQSLRVKGAEEIAAAFLEGKPKHWVNQKGVAARG